MVTRTPATCRILTPTSCYAAVSTTPTVQNAKSAGRVFSRRRGRFPKPTSLSNANRAIASVIALTALTIPKWIVNVYLLTFMEIMMAAVYVRTVAKIRRESIVTNVNQLIIVLMRNSGTRQMSVNPVIVTFSTRLATVRRERVNASAEKSIHHLAVTRADSDTTTIPTANRATATSTALKPRSVKPAMANASASIITVVNTASSALISITTFRIVNLANVTLSARFRPYAIIRMVIAPAKRTMVENNAISAAMDITVTHRAHFVTVTFAAPSQKYAIRFPELACVRKGMRERGVISASRDIMVTLIVNLATVPQ
uniref:Uncharacterized protein n=1 Tax=Photinus pyralis TaxID=7054 RepID=A0A1Y1MXY1_PHOPY